LLGAVAALRAGVTGGGERDGGREHGGEGERSLAQGATRPAGPVSSPYAVPNIRLFIVFRVLFNARFYYPVFTVLFLDYGLSLEQFAVLNTVWAVTIVLAEVPSGALADLLGRRLLLIATSLLMVAETALIAFVPLGNPQVIFWAFLGNRVLSGLAEAMASGADEALAYDTLVAHGQAAAWPRVLEVQMRAQSVGYIFAMTIGAMVYDPDMVNRVLGWMAPGTAVTLQATMRYPLYLTLVFGLLALATTARMREPRSGAGRFRSRTESAALWEAPRLIVRAGRWILGTPLVLAVILFATVFDHTLRMLATLTSEYYRLVGLPEASFGLLGSAAAVIGLFIPRLARVMAERFSPGTNALLVGLVALTALLLLPLFIPYYGALPMMLVFIGLTMTSYFTSHYLNALTDSQQRATVLSFKGLVFNAAYGIIGLAYAGVIQLFRRSQAGVHPDWPPDLIADQAFKFVMGCFPPYLLAGLALVSLCCLPRLIRGRSRTRRG